MFPARGPSAVAARGSDRRARREVCRVVDRYERMLRAGADDAGDPALHQAFDPAYVAAFEALLPTELDELFRRYLVRAAAARRRARVGRVLAAVVDAFAFWGDALGPYAPLWPGWDATAFRSVPAGQTEPHPGASAEDESVGVKPQRRRRPS
ncbi:hypothetical protein ET445_09890 [Agromyces protaetiae]|uniref:Uncharacterized protein n=1 Tax=Agromyces protaetiae TaxID=2509455 RepID=A0A4P6FEY6_9MICO|nr:hypothetical protein [Agromyces protaetiae]QAY73603.1 hypothetical protein ET445_09890 [Agromyces protaetiae]